MTQPPQPPSTPAEPREPESVVPGAAEPAGADIDTDAALRPTYGQQFIYEHCMPFDVSRAYDEATAHADPRG